MTCFQQSDVKTNYQTRFGNLNHCGLVAIKRWFKFRDKMGKEAKSKLRLSMADTIKKCVQIKVKVKFFHCVPNVAWQQMVNHFSTGNRLPSVSFLDSLHCGMFSAVLELKALSIKVAELLDPILRYRYYNLRISYCVLVTFDFNSRFFAIFDTKNELFYIQVKIIFVQKKRQSLG